MLLWTPRLVSADLLEGDDCWQIVGRMFPPPFASKFALPLLILCSSLLSGRYASAGTVSRLLDCDGRAVDPFSHSDAKLLAFVFVRTDCPISNGYAPEIQRLYTQFAPQGVAFWLVYPDSDESPSKIRKHLRDYSYPCAALRDPHHAFAKLAHAEVTPEAAIFRPDGELIYHGRIDDRFVDFGKARVSPTRRDFAEALAGALAGKAVDSAIEPAIGCFIEEAQ